MPSKRISELSAISALDDDDVLAVVEDGVNKKVTIAQLRALFGAGGFLPNLIIPTDIRLFTDTGGSLNANVAQLHPCIVPISGTITDVAIYVVTQSGNVDVGIYSRDATRTRLWSSGSTACPAAGAWRVIGTANLAVQAGDAIELAYAVDNNTTALLRHVAPATSYMDLPSSFLLGGAALPKLAARATSSFPLPSTIAEGSLTSEQPTMAIAAVIT